MTLTSTGYMFMFIPPPDHNHVNFQKISTHKLRQEPYKVRVKKHHPLFRKKLQVKMWSKHKQAKEKPRTGFGKKFPPEKPELVKRST